ncbi:Coiled-coil domain-containing protein 87, partial [Cladochytrium tenue]
LGERRSTANADVLGTISATTKKPAQSIPSVLKAIVGEIESVAWLNPDEREQLVNTFISDLAYRYNKVQHLLVPRFTPEQNRQFVVKLFQRIGLAKNLILEKCRQKKAAMDTLGIFAEDANSARVISLFRTELHKSDALDSVIHPVPKVEPPTISRAYLQSSMRTQLLKDGLNSSTSSPSTDPIAVSAAAAALPSPRAPLQPHRAALARFSLRLPWPESSNAVTNAGPSARATSARWRPAAAAAAPTLNSPAALPERVAQLQVARKIARNGGNDDDDDDDDDDDGLDDSGGRRRGLYALVESSVDEPVLSSHSIGTTYSVVQTVGFKVSQRVPKGFISLSAEPASAISEFGTEVEASTLDVLDEKLSRHKEVEELYDEIMKTIVGDHLDADDQVDDLTCPAAPYDPKIPISNAYLGIAAPAFPQPPVETAAAPSDSDSSSGHKNTSRSRQPVAHSAPEIRLTTRRGGRVAVLPDEFATDRAAAMRRTPSSRYAHLRFNFGGYIPHEASAAAAAARRRRRRAPDPFGPTDYLRALRLRACDFVLDLLVDRDEDARELRLAAEVHAATRAVERARRRAERRRRRRAEHRRRLTEFRRGKWNAGVLELIGEIGGDIAAPAAGDSGSETESEDFSGEDGGSDTTDGSGENGEESPPAAAQEAESEVLSESVGSRGKSRRPTSGQEKGRRGGTPRPQDARSKSTGDMLAAQQKLESLWVVLKMPLDQKLDMAIKYGSYKFAPKMEMAISLWATAGEFITEREALLQRMRTFELTASDPERFFRPGHEGSSEARMQEARERDEMLRKMDWLEARILDVVSHIKNELNETVTFM